MGYRMTLIIETQISRLYEANIKVKPKYKLRYILSEKKVHFTSAVFQGNEMYLHLDQSSSK